MARTRCRVPLDQGRRQPHRRPPDGRPTEIGTLSGKAVSKLAGLAPIARDSGKLAGRRRVRGGREGVRSILFVVAGLVSRYDPDFAAFRQRLAAAGKPPKAVRTALAHKLLVRLNAKARDVRNELQNAA